MPDWDLRLNKMEKAQSVKTEPNNYRDLFV